MTTDELLALSPQQAFDYLRSDEFRRDREDAARWRKVSKHFEIRTEHRTWEEVVGIDKKGRRIVEDKSEVVWWYDFEGYWGGACATTEEIPSFASEVDKDVMADAAIDAAREGEL